MFRPIVTFVLGGPGSGKGTQCKRICDEFGFVHLSAGDLLRAERNLPNSQYGELIERYIREGKIVPVEITCSLLERAMNESTGSGKFLIDGFPRNEDNLSGWTRNMSDKVDVKFVLFLDCPHDACVQRCLSRGEQGSNRSDDNEASLRKRLETFVNDTMPIVEHYRGLNLLKMVDGDRSPDKVYEDVRQLYSKLKDVHSEDGSSRPKAVVCDNDDRIQVTLSYKHNNDDIMFNLDRKKDEKLADLFQRLRCNLDKKLTRSRKPMDPESLSLKYHISLTDIDGNKLNPETTTNHEAWQEGSILRIDDHEFVVSRNEPQVVSIKLPRSVMAGFVVSPEIKLAHCDIKSCQMRWYRQVFKPNRETEQSIDGKNLINDGSYNWEQMTQNSFAYFPSPDDVGRRLRFSCTPARDDKVGFERVIVSNKPVEAGPGRCLFEDRHAFTGSRLIDPNSFRMVTYNILADLYADSDYSRTVLFPYCPAYALDYDYRRQLLLKELLGYNADLICLQEVDKRAYKHDLEPTLAVADLPSAAGDDRPELLDDSPKFFGLFHAKAGQVAEGLATFYRHSRFCMLGSCYRWIAQLIDPSVATGGDTSVEKQSNHHNNGDNINPIDSGEPTTSKQLSDEFFQPPMKLLEDIRRVINSNEALAQRFKNRKTIVQISVLQNRQMPSKAVVVANTHLYFHPDSDHIRLLQGSILAKYLEFVKQRVIEHLKLNHQQQRDNSIDVDDNGTYDIEVTSILCGDLNSSPDCGLYRLMLTGYVPATAFDWHSNKTEAVEGLEVRQGLRYASAYDPLPDYTNYTPEFKACLDYIYYEPSVLQVQATVPLPDHELVAAHEALPSVVHPSDHLALVADFAWKAR
ncbi:2',5'-phosphodiesterase 12, partial [Fragariocoptes setiger]